MLATICRARALLRLLGADGLALLVSTLMVAFVIVWGGGRLALQVGSLAAPAQTFAPIVLFSALLRRRDGVRRALLDALRDWSPFFLLYVLYGNLQAATGFLAGRAVERQILNFDEWLFGVEPSAWIQQFATPLLTDVMALAYALLFLLPFLVMVPLLARGRRRAFRELTVALLFCTFGGFLLYLCAPARSPRWACPEIYSTQLHGAFGFYEWLTGAWDHVELMLYDAFPSLHVAISTVALVYAFRLGRHIWPRRPRALGGLLLVPVALLQVSTLYLRQHYFIDVPAGWALAALVCRLAPWLGRAFERLAGHEGARPAAQALAG
jgi:membrane-associated phospholipid phosphatase